MDLRSEGLQVTRAALLIDVEGFLSSLCFTIEVRGCDDLRRVSLSLALSKVLLLNYMGSKYTLIMYPGHLGIILQGRADEECCKSRSSHLG